MPARGRVPPTSLHLGGLKMLDPNGLAFLKAILFAGASYFLVRCAMLILALLVGTVR